MSEVFASNANIRNVQGLGLLVVHHIFPIELRHRTLRENPLV